MKTLVLVTYFGRCCRTSILHFIAFNIEIIILDYPFFFKPGSFGLSQTVLKFSTIFSLITFLKKKMAQIHSAWLLKVVTNTYCTANQQSQCSKGQENFADYA